MSRKEKRKHRFAIIFICFSIAFIVVLVFCAIFTYNNTWTYDDYKFKRVYDNKEDCMRYHSLDDCLDKDYAILKDSE